MLAIKYVTVWVYFLCKSPIIQFRFSKMCVNILLYILKTSWYFKKFYFFFAPKGAFFTRVLLKFRFSQGSHRY